MDAAKLRKNTAIERKQVPTMRFNGSTGKIQHVRYFFGGFAVLYQIGHLDLFYRKVWMTKIEKMASFIQRISNGGNILPARNRVDVIVEG